MKTRNFIIFWIISILLTTIYVYENPEKIDYIKDFFKGEEEELVESKVSEVIEANSFNLKFEQVYEFQDAFKTAFVIYDNKSDEFDFKKLLIYFQDSQFFENNKYKFLNLTNEFTEDYNGGVKTIFTYKKIKFALITSLINDCYFVSIVNTVNQKVIFKTKCLNEGEINFAGVGSTNIHYKGKIYLSIGAPGWNGIEIANLAQNKNSFFGKIIEINQTELDDIIKEKIETINPSIFSIGHRNPQGLTILNETIFSTEHGPRGGDELNKLIKGKNYGWPISSYGVKYKSDLSEITYLKSHEDNNFVEPLFALVPSVGLSSVNNCPAKLKDYYKKPCLIALSLYGNDLRSGKSLLIYLLNNDLTKVQSVEKIFIGNDYPLRHFVTNNKNELYEDNKENIYVSVDGKGIYRINFFDFIKN